MSEGRVHAQRKFAQGQSAPSEGQAGGGQRKGVGKGWEENLRKGGGRPEIYNNNNNDSDDILGRIWMTSDEGCV